MLSEGAGDAASKPLLQGQTTLVVVKISKTTPTQGLTYRMYLDPVIGSPEPGFPAVQYGVNAVSALPTSLSIDNGTGFTTDEIRVGTTWTSVLPPEVSSWSNLGFGKPGSSGVPLLVGSGPLSVNSSNQFTLANANPASTAILVSSVTLLNMPVKGGILVPAPDLLIYLVTNASGSLSVPFILPAGAGPGVPLRLQYWIEDAGAPYGYSASNGLQGVTQ